MKLLRDDGTEFEANMVRASEPYEAAMRRIRSGADEVGERWRDLSFGKFQVVHARTVHVAQGETQQRMVKSLLYMVCQMTPNAPMLPAPEIARASMRAS
jgi:hypothetical protein